MCRLSLISEVLEKIKSFKNVIRKHNKSIELRALSLGSAGNL